MKSEFASTCTDFCHGIKHDKTIIFYALLIYMKEKYNILLAIFGGAIIMKTNDLTHAIRNSEHITTLKTFFALNTMEGLKHSLEFRHFGFNVFTKTWHF